jgi:two-component system sensor histidine kinase KdpD
VTRIVVGKPMGRTLKERMAGSLLDRLIRSSGNIEVIATTGEEHAERLSSSRYERKAAAPPIEYVWALAIVGASALVCVLTRRWFQTVDQAMLMLLGVILCARRFSFGPSVAAIVAAVALFDFLFVPPFFTFSVSDVRYVVTFGVMLVVGLMVSRLAVKIRAGATSARERERRTAALFAMSRELMLAESRDAVVDAAMRHLRDFFKADNVVLLAEEAEGRTDRAEPGIVGGEREQAIARWVYEHGKPAGHGTNTLPGTDVLFLPLAGSAGSLGVLGIALGRRAEPLTPSQRQLLETFVGQIAQALDRVRLSEEAASARIAAETERTRSTLLSAVSHDLRTPLTTISGAAEALLERSSPIDEAGRRDLLETVREEAARLTRLINDLLDLTRLEAGGLKALKEWQPLDEIVAGALSQLESRLSDRTIELDLPKVVVFVPVDAPLIGQVLVNLVENAIKYSEPEQPVTIRARIEESEAVVEVLDRGRGIPPGEEKAIFERFYRAADSQRAQGTGLGLAICRAIVRAHDGTIEAHNREGGGTVFRFTLPLVGANRVGLA